MLYSAELAKIHKARRDSAYLGEYVFGWTNADFHVRWHRVPDEHKRFVIFASVEHGKSRQLSVTRPLWEIGNDPNTTGAIISDAARQSEGWLALIAQTIETSPRYQAVFPWVRKEQRPGRIQKWGAEAIIVERDDVTVKDPTVQAVGVEGAILGVRLRWCILDDPLSFQSTLTDAGRQKTLDWYRSTIVGRMLDTAAGSSWVGWILTAWDEDDAPHRLVRESGYEGFKFPAHAVGDNTRDVLWPEAWPAERLALRREELREFEYGRQFLCDVASDVRRIFKREWMAQCRELAAEEGLVLCDGRPPGAAYRIGVGVDLAVQKGRENDLTCFFVLGYDVLTQTRRVLWIESGQWEFPEIVQRLISVHERFHPDVFVVEDNAAQAYLVQHLQHTTAINVVGRTTGRNKWDPEIGIQAMAPDFEYGKWRLPEGQEVDHFMRELIDFRPGQHTGDRAMAGWHADSYFTRSAGRAVSGYYPAGM